jgi:hypothetical protein
MQDLWPDFEAAELKENHSLEILRSQAKLLEKKTDGKVRAVFSRIKYTTNKQNINAVLSLSRSVATALEGPPLIEVLENDLIDRVDANNYFNDENYKFEIYNDNLRFRVFKVTYNIMYPITIEMDAGVAQDITMGTSMQVNSDTDLVELLERVFKSRKLILIIKNLMVTKKTND